MKTYLKILMVEGATSDVDLIKHEITKNGIQFNTHVVKTKEEYVKALGEFKPDIILSDNNLANFDGVTALSLKNEHSPMVPFILITVSTDEKTGIQILNSGADDYLIKEHISRIGNAIRTAISRKETEEKLRVFSRAVEQSPASITIADKAGNIEYVNQNYTRLTGYQIEDLIGRSLRKIQSGSITDSDYDRLWDTITHGSEWSGESQNRKKSGELYFERTSISPISDEKGNITHFVAIQEDISSQRQIGRMSNTFTRAIDQNPSCVVITDLNGKIEYINPAYASFMNCTLDEVKGTYPSQFNTENTPKKVIDEMWKTIRAGNTWKNENVKMKVEGKMCWCNVVISPIMGDNSQITNYLLTLEDVSNRKKRIDELDENRERAEYNSYLKSELLTRISHKIRTPLNTIEGFSDFLNDPNLDSEKRKQFTELITQSNSQLLDIITELVDNDVFEDGLESTHRAGLNLNALLEKIDRHFTSKNQNKDVVLRHKSALSDADSNVLTDEIKVEHVLTNLIENALKFTSKGHVEFGYRVRGNNLEFYVEDTGTGIPNDLREELLRPLYTDGDQEHRTSISGMGLSFARTYVELLGGKFWLDTKPNKGSTFYFSIPYVKDTPAEWVGKKSRSVSTTDIKKPPTLLIAEDEDLNFKLMLLILSKLGIKTIRAKNGSEAVDLVRSNKDIDLVLMDINMPVMDGYEATRKLKEISPDMPVIAQTAYSSYENQEKAMDCGCSDFISKPFNKEELISKINEQLVNRQ